MTRKRRVSNPDTPSNWVRAIDHAWGKIKVLVLEYRTGRAAYEEIRESEVAVGVAVVREGSEWVVANPDGWDDAQSLAKLMWSRANDHAPSCGAKVVDYNLLAYDENDDQIFSTPKQCRVGDGLGADSGAAAAASEQAAILGEYRLTMKGQREAIEKLADAVGRMGGVCADNTKAIGDSSRTLIEAAIAANLKGVEMQQDAAEFARQHLYGERQAVEAEATKREAWASIRSMVKMGVWYLVAEKAMAKGEKPPPPPTDDDPQTETTPADAGEEAGPRPAGPSEADVKHADPLVRAVRKIEPSADQLAALRAKLGQRLADALTDANRYANQSDVDPAVLRDALLELAPELAQKQAALLTVGLRPDQLAAFMEIGKLLGPV